MYNPTDNEISLKVHKMHLYSGHTVNSFPLYIFLGTEDGPHWPKHVVVSIINRIQDCCVLTNPTPSLISDKTCRRNQNTYFILFSKIILLMRKCCKSIVEPGRTQMTLWRMHIAWRINTAPNTHRICNTHCFSTTKSLHLNFRL